MAIFIRIIMYKVALANYISYFNNCMQVNQKLQHEDDNRQQSIKERLERTSFT